MYLPWNYRPVPGSVRVLAWYLCRPTHGSDALASLPSSVRVLVSYPSPSKWEQKFQVLPLTIVGGVLLGQVRGSTAMRPLHTVSMELIRQEMERYLRDSRWERCARVFAAIDKTVWWAASAGSHPDRLVRCAEATFTERYIWTNQLIQVESTAAHHLDICRPVTVAGPDKTDLTIYNSVCRVGQVSIHPARGMSTAASYFRRRCRNVISGRSRKTIPASRH